MSHMKDLAIEQQNAASANNETTCPRCTKEGIPSGELDLDQIDPYTVASECPVHGNFKIVNDDDVFYDLQEATLDEVNSIARDELNDLELDAAYHKAVNMANSEAKSESGSTSYRAWYRAELLNAVYAKRAKEFTTA